MVRVAREKLRAGYEWLSEIYRGIRIAESGSRQWRDGGTKQAPSLHSPGSNTRVHNGEGSQSFRSDQLFMNRRLFSFLIPSAWVPITMARSICIR